jgi:hypothetical protein
VLMPISRQARIILTAISPRLAIRIFENIFSLPVIYRITAVCTQNGTDSL